MKKLLTIFITTLLISTIAFNAYSIPFEMSEIVSTENTEEKTITTRSDNIEVVEAPDYIVTELFLPTVTYSETTTEQETSNLRTYNVSFKAYVDNEIKDYVDITVINLNTKTNYSFRLFELNEYFKVVVLPAGEYKLISGNAAGDMTNKYPVENVYFIVGTSLNIFVPFNVGSPDVPYSHDPSDFQEIGYTIPQYDQMSESDIESVSAESSTAQRISEETENKKSGIFSKIFPVFFLIIVLVIYVFRKKQHSSPVVDDNNDYKI